MHETVTHFGENTEFVVGFDCRTPQTVGEGWSSERKTQFALRSDCDRILSTDTAVWPSVLDELDEWKGPIQDLWDDLERMKKQASALVGELDCIQVAFSLLARQCSVDELSEWQEGAKKPVARADGATTWEDVDRIRADSIQPSLVSPEWELLGYDVSDKWLTSGLSNCGYAEEEKSNLVAVFSGSLNSNHLFSSPDVASRFKVASDQRIREHSPFFVYGLYRTSKPLV